ncbi:MAG: altronate dehydratase family protein [Peptococcaceae bacterium]|jgi:altronate hydrolase|nr:altronate dehydratase family protein [Peptococcaceae bacterium]
MNMVKIHPADNVAVTVQPVSVGQALTIGTGTVAALSEANAGHKLAIADIPEGSPVIKYGYPIGFATTAIKAGEHVHSHNLRTSLDGLRNYAYHAKLTPPAPQKPGKAMCFRRGDDKVGIRNEIWIIPTTGCVNSIGEIVARKAQSLIRGSVQGVYSFPHPYGCSQLGEDHDNTKKALGGLVRHPNAGGVLVLGLGCENNGVEGMKKLLGNINEDRVKFLVCQECEDEVTAALDMVNALITVSQNDAREPVSVSELIVGLKCGGSDGLSGITANPLVGVFSDRLVAEGGSTILTEVPEMFGAETMLMDRCNNDEVFHKLVSLINGYKAYFTDHGQPVYENPSPGNKIGGITTLEEKSLGCTQKAGSATVADVLPYGEALREKGLNLLQAPGNDLVASTALAVSGAHLILFTTGRGTPFGSPVPTIKIASNTPLYKKKCSWIDFDAGALTAGSSLGELADELYAYVIALASGEAYTKAEQNGIRDIAIFKDGVTL